MSISMRSAVLGGCALLLVVGCERYEPQPLDLPAQHQAWLDRDADALNQTLAAHQAEPFDLNDGISLAEAEIVALFANPRLRVTRSEAGIPAATIEHADAWKDPALGVDAEYILDSDADEPWILGAGIALTIPLSGRPAVRKRLATAKLETAEAAVLGAEWALINQVRRAWVELTRIHHHIRTGERHQEELNYLTRSARDLLAAGVLDRESFATLLSFQANYRNDLSVLRRNLTTQHVRIIGLLGLHPGHEWDFQPRWPAEKPSAVDDLRDGLAIIQQHPQLAMVASAYQVAERELELEIRKQYPDLTIGFGGGQDKGQSQIQLALGLIPIPLWNRNRAGIAEAKANRTSTSAEASAVMQELVQRVAFNRQQMRAANAQLMHLQAVVAPSAIERERIAQDELAHGHIELSALHEAVHNRHQLERKLINAAATLYIARSDLLSSIGPTEAGAQP